MFLVIFVGHLVGVNNVASGDTRYLKYFVCFFRVFVDGDAKMLYMYSDE